MMTAEQLKGTILQLAMQGKLVKQRPEEGTGEDLYKEIQIEKKRLIREGKVKKKLLSDNEMDDIPFDIPDSWQWVRISEISSIINGDRGKYYPSKSTLSHEGIPFISALNLDGRTVVKDDSLLCVSQEQYDRLGSGKLEKGDIVVCIRGSLGKHGRYPFEKGAIASSLVICRQFIKSEAMALFIMNFLDAPLFFDQIKQYDNGTAQPNLAAKSLEQFYIPLPPLEEQKRIVAKIEELMPFVEQYAAASTKLNTLNATFPEMMKKSILQEAVQGRLVPQDPNDEPASLLLKKIAEEKKRLIKEGKIKKQKPLSEITEDEIPFDIPESWEWVRFENAVDMLSGFAFKSSDFVQDGEYRLLRGINLGVGEVRWDDTVYVNNIPDKLSIYQLKKGDVLLGLDRPWISNGIRAAVFNGLENTYLVQRVLRIREIGVLSCEYVALILRSSLLSAAVQGQTTGISVPHISPKQVGNIAVPVPPVEEQKRIVEKVKLLCTEIDSFRQ